MTNQSKVQFDKENFIKLWKEFDYEVDESELTKVIKEWGKYKEKIKNGLFGLDDYTSLKNNDNPSLPDNLEKNDNPKGYLCNFIERHTDCFGSSRPGNANQFMVKANAPDEEKPNQKPYYVAYVKEKNQDKKIAEKYFKEKILPILQIITNSKKLSKENIEKLEKDKYQAKQILRKMLVLEHPTDLIHIYKDETINALYKEFELEHTTTNLEKNRAILKFIKDINVKEEKVIFPTDTKEQICKLSTFLWRYANAKSIVDDDSPNIILYGPPGT
ncbi:MAG: hypothetical protein KGV46_02395, partial [Pasteurella sp.]|nr:hypothetical protein [Pasteurella sp.]